MKIEMKKEKSGIMIFSPFNLYLFPVTGTEINPEGRRSYSAQNTGEIHEVTIPGHMALEIGHLNNNKFESSKQNFINGRIFNFVRAQSGKTEVTRDTFEANFKKISAGYAWQLPAE